MNNSLRGHFRLSLCKGEGRVRVRSGCLLETLTFILSPFQEGRGERRRGAEHTLDERANPRRSSE
jgi:hypothetical protein